MAWWEISLAVALGMAGVLVVAGLFAFALGLLIEWVQR